MHALAIAVLLAGGAAEPAPSPPGAAETVDFSADRSLRMTVPVSIGGRGPFDFVVDTGAERTVLSEELANTLGLGRTGSANVHSISGVGRFETVTVPSLSVTNTPVRNVRAPLFRRGDLGAEGLLGVDSLQSKAILIDFARQTIVITPASKTPDLEADDDSTIVIRARSRLGRLILADAAIGHRRIAVVIDTGAEHSVGNFAMRKAAVKRGKASLLIPTTLHDVAGGSVPAEIALVDDMRLGSVTLMGMPIAFADLPVFRQLGLDTRPAMLLGMNTLRAFEQVAVDFATRKVRFVVPGGGNRETDTRIAAAAP
ncbi:aspartyl protease family protein [Sphingosinicella soli]|uniref:Putative aspartyl protease n=1 Tax=Sphingosinicella soli TaxID=333708 RepID=A0A7W7AZ60_9SPHN|nr:aspartyl protease family protein [Sphingosinicella soli]MBB4631048.1 putative aspartyl protease [Sphingosinicella soli]